ncbi:MAG: hypothetical protein JNK66_04460 [Chitinophagales bacterium]|nr:hypothetical protein [Chitinophagales bacterium]
MRSFFKVRPIIITVPVLLYSGMAVFPFILIQNKELAGNDTLIRHEQIHLKQQVEMLVIPFYVIYLINYLINLVIYRQHDKAYREIIFEREAYANEQNGDYLSQRPVWSFMKYV